ncbi:MAG: D-alanyl-D-alanine carboxypeptidase/D-alanyl-D-alanine-endopeptidase [Marinilabiliaceae bacterium]|nr:D-alanyl-D-alanine carboxypeptidase/D-alanyl-D-alanine-endopeptidase [Marinilabiliaceae bacterium]
MTARFFTAILMLLYSTVLNAQRIELSGTEVQSALVVDVATGEIIAEYNCKQRLVPASLTKLVTTAAALDILGQDYRIKTEFYLVRGNKNASLIVRGYGDPTTGSEYFEESSISLVASRVAEALKKQGILHLSKVEFDDSYIKGPGYIDKHVWEDMGNYYGATPKSLNIYDNIQNIYLSSPQKAGELCSIIGRTPNEDSQIDCYVQSYSGKSDSAYVYGVDDGCRYISGAIPAGQSSYKVKSVLPNVQYGYCNELSKELRNTGIVVDMVMQESVEIDMTESELIMTTYSPTVLEMITMTNQKSINMFAEAISLAVAAGKDGNSSSWGEATRSLRAFGKRTMGIEPELYDGSGLSPFNSLSSRELVDLLLYISRQPYSKSFRESLAKAGETGTLSSWGRGSKLQGRTIGKSGTMTGVIGYAGYVNGNNGKEYAFSILVNHAIEKRQDVRAKVAKWLSHTIFDSK